MRHRVTVAPLPSLILIDVLGVRARWGTGARHAVSAFETLAELVETAIEDAPPAVLGAEIESDTAVVACRSTNAALRFVRMLYLDAFLGRSAAEERRERLWLRGVLVPRPPSLEIDEVRTPRRRAGGRVVVNDLAPAFTAAVALEKSGFKGMRFVVHGDLVTSKVKAAAAVRTQGGGSADTVVRISGDRTYPSALKGFHDYLWMATSDDDEWKRITSRMARRLRQAAHDPDEVVQAAGTQVAFDACAELRAAETPQGRTRSARGKLTKT